MGGGLSNNALKPKTIPLVTVFITALLIYGISAGDTLFKHSLAPHYVHLADAFLHGRTNIDDVGLTIDTILYEDVLYVPSPPLPAVLFVPYVSIFGISFSDILFSVVLGAINVTLVHAIFRKVPLTIFFALGTPHWYFSVLGSVWFQAQASAILFTLLSILILQRFKHPLATGAMWALALLARPTILFGILFPLAYLWSDDRSASNRYKKLGLFMLPIVVSVCLMGFYNQIRFDDWREFGYAHMLGAPNITAAIAQYGTFDLSYLACNLRVSIIEPPVINNQISDTLLNACKHLIPSGEITLSPKPVQPNPIGMSLFLASPLFFLLPISLRDLRKNWVVWVSLLAVMLPNWLVHNTGSLQFGYRYWMDGAVLWLILLANMLDSQMQQRWQKGVIIFLIAISVLINCWGLGWMYQIFMGYNWFQGVMGLFTP